MARKLRGERYAEGASPTLVEFIKNKLPYLSFIEAMEFYRDWVPRMTGTEVALLGGNDRFFLLTGLLNRPDAIHPWLYDRAREIEFSPDGHLDLWARGHYKAVDVNEAVATPDGWRKHGDLRPGDSVFGPDGKPTRVVARTPVFTDADCYRVTFCDGYTVVVSGEHLWTVNLPDRSRISGTDERKKWKTETLYTRQLLKHVAEAKSISSRRYPTIPVAEAIQYPAQDLPISPYVLGAWLGDGATGGTRITSGIDDAAEMKVHLEGAGALVHEATHSNSVSLRIGNGKCGGNNRKSDVVEALRELGIYQDKRIPQKFLRSSIDQRWELLQGLMDTDGSCAKSCGQAIFCAANESLARDAFDLAQSLGLKATIAERSGVYKGEPRPYWQVQFLGRAAKPPFKLARKIANCSTEGKLGVRRVVQVEPVASQPVSCIQVERDDGLYLIGRNYVTTHNSTIGTFAGVIQEVLINPEIRIGIFGNAKDISRPFLSQIKEELQTNQRLIDLYPDVLYKNPTTDAKTWSVDGGLVVKRKSNPKEATIEAHGLIDGMPTGRHFVLLVYDDIITERNVTNPEQLKKATERVELSDNLGTGDGTRKWFFGTRYHYGDSYGHLIEHEVVKPRLHPATVDGTLDGEPVFLSQKAWDEKKKSQRTQIAAQMLQNPTAGQENTFYVKWLKPYYVRPYMMNIYIMGDPSKGKNKTSDRTALVVVGIDPQGNKYLLDGYCHRMSLSDRWTNLKNLYIRWTKMAGVQSVRVGYERYGMQSDDEHFDEKMRLEGPRFEIKELNWTRESGRESKGHRVERLEPDFRHGSFFVPATVWHTAVDGHEALWSLKEGTDEFEYRKKLGPHMQERRARANGENWRLMDPIRRLDEDGNIYDLTRVFFEEFRFFPFAPRDDLIDATSRIYDMEPQPARLHEAVPVQDYEDA